MHILLKINHTHLYISIGMAKCCTIWKNNALTLVQKCIKQAYVLRRG